MTNTNILLRKTLKSLPPHPLYHDVHLASLIVRHIHTFTPNHLDLQNFKKMKVNYFCFVQDVKQELHYCLKDIF